MPNIATDSVQLIHTSIPFGNHYEYTTQMEYFGVTTPQMKSSGVKWTSLSPNCSCVEWGLFGYWPSRQRPHSLWPPNQERIHGSLPLSMSVMAFKKHGWLYEGRRTYYDRRGEGE